LTYGGILIFRDTVKTFLNRHIPDFLIDGALKAVFQWAFTASARKRTEGFWAELKCHDGGNARYRPYYGRLNAILPGVPIKDGERLFPSTLQ